jgi:hypothetical protein
MSDENTPAGTSVPAVPAAVAPTAAAVPPPPAPLAPVAPLAPPATPELDPQWLSSRLERAKSIGKADLLKELGATDPIAAKAAIEAARAAEESKKTAEQRAIEAANKLSLAEQSRARSDALIKEQAARMMMVLSPDQQKAITDFAGDEPAEQLRAIQHFVPLWAKTPAMAPAATEADAELTDADIAELEANLKTVKEARAAKTAGSPPPATTSPPPGSPPATTPGSPPDHRAVYSALATKNPFAAAAYGLQHFGAVHNNKH